VVMTVCPRKDDMKNYEEITAALQDLDGRNGLPEEIFLAISTLTPIVNVDLLVRDDVGQILLSWRSDAYFGCGWHLPGGCIRFKETMEERLQKTAMEELHSQVFFEKFPLAVKDVVVNKEESVPRFREHHLAVLYDCRFPADYKIQNGKLEEQDAGYLKWFSKIPDNILEVHSCYQDIFKQLNLWKE